MTPELLDALRALLAQTTISEEATTSPALASPRSEREVSTDEQQANIAQEPTRVCENEQGANNYERVKVYLAGHPYAKVRDVAEALTISVSTANKWMLRMRSGCWAGRTARRPCLASQRGSVDR